MMTIDLDSAFRRRGTRFRVFPQSPSLSSIVEPETIWVSRPPGTVGPGPADDQMYVRDALYKREPYEAPDLPPYRGETHAPALPDENGHFDHIPPHARQFKSAHMYAVIRRVLDVWECYLGRSTVWHFANFYERLELIPLLDWDNAQSGFGFIETGYRPDQDDVPQLFCLNFDVLAHEIGHSIVYSEVGWPTPGTETSQYFGFQEAAADITALIAVLHFGSVVDRLLQDTRGNLYALNELNRIAELSDMEQLRVASNDRRMSHYAAGWEKEHQLSQPLTGALFDILVDVFHRLLFERGLIDGTLAADASDEDMSPEEGADVQSRFDAEFRGQHGRFRFALLDARDYFGTLIAEAWTRLSAPHLTYVDVGHALLDTDLRIAGGRYRHEILSCFAWREIGAVAPGPKLTAATASGTFSCR